MKHLVLCGLVLIFAGSIHALGSHVDSGLISLDTVPPVLELLSPLGGEAWYIGDTRNILWDATDPNLELNSVNLWYSLNGGSTYLSLAQSIEHSGSYPWELPAVQSYNARVRVGIRDSFGNQSLRHSNGVFSITYVPPGTPTNISINTNNRIDAVITWDPVTHTIPEYNTPIIPDGYIVLYSETPSEDEHFFYFLGRSYTTTYTHHDVVEFRNQMFYRVKAYKNYSRGEAEALEALLQSRSVQPLLWGEAQTLIRKGAAQ